MKLAPSILSFDPLGLREAVPALEAAGAEILHLDIMDGQFVPPISFGDSLTKALRPLTKMVFEAHLMTDSPENQFEAFIGAGCERIIFHSEATRHSHRLAQQLRAKGVSPGIAINPGTPVEAVLPVLDMVDLVLVMTVNPGWGGQNFLAETMPKVQRIRELRDDILIEVDGGIDPDTIGIASKHGADVFVVGSYLCRAASIQAGVEALRARCERKR